MLINVKKKNIYIYTSIHCLSKIRFRTFAFTINLHYYKFWWLVRISHKQVSLICRGRLFKKISQRHPKLPMSACFDVEVCLITSLQAFFCHTVQSHIASWKCVLLKLNPFLRSFRQCQSKRHFLPSIFGWPGNMSNVFFFLNECFFALRNFGWRKVSRKLLDFRITGEIYT